jgi:hypothetical protein
MKEILRMFISHFRVRNCEIILVAVNLPCYVGALDHCFLSLQVVAVPANIRTFSLI